MLQKGGRRVNLFEGPEKVKEVPFGVQYWERKGHHFRSVQRELRPNHVVDCISISWPNVDFFTQTTFY